jgi:DMSO reductase anchor subunit
VRAPALVAPVAALVVTAAVAKAALELSVLFAIRRDVDDDLHRTARLLFGDLRTATQGRFLLLAVGAITAVFATAEPAPAATVFAVIAVATLTAGELIERSQFFRAVAAPAMPGGLS